jgi:hypothetical protein
VVAGLDRFAEHFAGYEDRYVLIGGRRHIRGLDAAALEFRVTKDLDIVLCLEALDVDFGRAFWNFIQAGGYEIAEKNTGGPVLYRFRILGIPRIPR